MPRRLLKKFLPDRHAVTKRWYLRPFGSALAQPAYWTLHRRSVTRAVSIGLFVSFIPLPIHLLIGPLLAMLLRANIPVTLVTLFVVNPFTAWPVYFGAYWLGSHVMGVPLTPLAFDVSWEWLSHHLQQIWKPLLVGCLIAGSVAAAGGYWVVWLVWRTHVAYRYRQRQQRSRAAGSAIDQNSTLQR